LEATLTKYRSQVTSDQSKAIIVNSVLPHSGKQNVITPQNLNALVKEVISSVGIDPRIVTLPDLDGGFRETDLNKYHGDFLRENFRYWASQACKLNADELDYLLRRKASTTLGRYYCDFLNEASQLIIQTKLNRWEATLIAETLVTPKKYHRILDANCNFRIEASSCCRKSALIELTTTGRSKISLRFRSPCGYSYEVMPDEDKEN
jgi:hypothetical protein